MDEFETRIAERLAAPGAGAMLPPQLAGRVLTAVEARRRRRRWMWAGVFAGVIALVVPLSLVVRGGPSASDLRPAPDQSRTPEPSRPVPEAPLASSTLDQMVDRSAASVFPVRLPDGLLFRAEALTPSGLVVGETGFDADPYRQSDDQVWLVGPEAARSVALGRYAWAYVASDSAVAWAEPLGDGYEYQLMCVELDQASHTPVQVSETGVAKWSPSGPILHDGTTFLWMDEGTTLQDDERLWTADGCGGVPHELTVTGSVVAVVGNEAYVVDPTDGLLRSVDLDSGAVSAVAELPRDLWADEFATRQFAVTDTVVAWTLDRTLTVLDRESGVTRQVTITLPGFCELQVGDVFVVCSSSPPETSPIGFSALVYDLRTTETVTLESDALTAGDLLLWREGTDYVIAPAR